MSKKLQITIGLSTLILALSFSYYLISYVPSREKAKQDFQIWQANRQVELDNARRNCINNVVQSNPPRQQALDMIQVCKDTFK
jgi:hypothetical protein